MNLSLGRSLLFFLLLLPGHTLFWWLATLLPLSVGIITSILFLVCLHLHQSPGSMDALVVPMTVIANLICSFLLTLITALWRQLKTAGMQ